MWIWSMPPQEPPSGLGVWGGSLPFGSNNCSNSWRTPQEESRNCYWPLMASYIIFKAMHLHLNLKLFISSGSSVPSVFFITSFFKATNMNPYNLDSAIFPLIRFFGRKDLTKVFTQPSVATSISALMMLYISPCHSHGIHFPTTTQADVTVPPQLYP